MSFGMILHSFMMHCLPSQKVFYQDIRQIRKSISLLLPVKRLLTTRLLASWNGLAEKTIIGSPMCGQWSMQKCDIKSTKRNGSNGKAQLSRSPIISKPSQPRLGVMIATRLLNFWTMKTGGELCLRFIFQGRSRRSAGSLTLSNRVDGFTTILAPLKPCISTLGG